MKQPREKLFVYKSTLKEAYGLTPGMIDELGPPDEYCGNPHWKSGPYPANLYLIRRVEAWIDANRERVEKAKDSRLKRRAAMKAVQERKREERHQKARELVLNTPIEVKTPFSTAFLEYAVECHRAAPHKDLLQRKGLHSYVRHQFTNYDSLRYKLEGLGFADEFYPLLRGRVDARVHAALKEWLEGLPPDWYIQADPTLRHKTEAFRKLEATLLAAAGRRVVLDAPEPYLDLLLERGRVFDGQLTRSLPGEREMSHSYNTARHYRRKRRKWDGNLDVVVGYRLARGGTWKQHSWLWNGSRLVVTSFTVSRFYFGVILDSAQAADFLQRALAENGPAVATAEEGAGVAA